jgi:Ca2+-binding RTX toxin-like protein
MLPVAIALPSAIVGGALLSSLSGLFPLAPITLPLIGKFVRSQIVDALKEVFGDDIDSLVNDFYNDAAGWLIDVADAFVDALRDQLIRLIDPIVLDLDGNGIELTSRASSGVYFDMDGDGIRELTGWLSPADGLLAIDANRNGRIDGIGELIGDAGQSGFAELATHDANGDLVINANDAVWSKLRVWIDANSNGITDSGELVSLNSLQIKAIDLNFTEVNFTAQGNRIHEQSVFEYRNGTVGTVADIWFDVDNVATASAATLTGNPAIDDLPDIRGHGDVESLRAVMLEDGTLASLVTALATLDLSDLDSAKAFAEQIIYRWAGVEGVSPTSRGTLFDGRKLAALEAFLGTEFFVQGSGNPNAQAVGNLARAWENLFDGMFARLLLAGPLKEALADSAVYIPEIDRLLTIQAPAELLASFAAQAPAEGGKAAAGYWAAVLPLAREIVQDVGGNTANADYRAAVAAALAPFGLAPFADLLEGGVQAVPTGSQTLGGTGMFQLSSGADMVYLTGGKLAVFGGEGHDRIGVLGGSSASRLLAGDAGDDELHGGSGSDWLDGGAGADVMAGGGGDDTYVVDNAGDMVFELPNTGIDEVRSTISYVLAEDLENLTLLGSAAIDGTGNAAANVITGNSAANRLKGFGGGDRLDGADGDDVMEGGLGADYYIVDTAGDVIIETGTHADTVQSAISYTLGTRLEHLILTGTAINGIGNARANQITGNDRDNLLDGGGGADTLKGGLGNDSYIVDHEGDKVSESPDAGMDLVRASATFSLSANIETLILTGDLDIDGTGNPLANQIIGNEGDNVLDGKAGDDTLSGGTGDDTYVVDSIGDTVTESASAGIDTVRTSLAAYTLGAHLENLQLFTALDNSARDGIGNGLANDITGGNGVNTLSGLGGNDILRGNGGNDVLRGGANNDLLDGGTGDDTMTGGTGDDTYVVNSIADVVSENAGEGADTVRSSISYILGANLEHLTLTGNAAIDAQGNNLANVLTGNGGHNNLDGSGGVDIMAGGAGNDIYTVDNVGDRVIELPGAGIDEVRSTVSYVLGFGLEHLQLLGSGNLSATGNAESNTIIGNAGRNTIAGGLGLDTMTGGGAADRFVFRDLAESGRTRMTCDLITDFGASDRIDILAIDAISATPGNEAFSFIGSDAFTAAGQLRFFVSGGDTYIALNTDSNFSTIEMMIGLDGEIALSEGYFTL